MFTPRFEIAYGNYLFDKVLTSSFVNILQKLFIIFYYMSQKHYRQKKRTESLVLIINDTTDIKLSNRLSVIWYFVGLYFHFKIEKSNINPNFDMSDI